jgi:hypothetical protein
MIAIALACASVLMLAGVAVADVAPVAVTPTIDFGRAVVGSGTYTKRVEFYNGTSSSFQLLSPMGATFGDFSVGDAGTCPRPPSPLVLAPGQTCDVTVRYTPTSSGPQAVIAAIGLCPLDALSIVNGPDGNPQSGVCPAQAVVGVPFAVMGSGVAADTLAAGPERLSFGSVPAQTQSAPQTVTLTNGSESTAITALSKSGPAADDFVIDTDSCTGAVLPPHATCTFNVRFAPSQTGERDAALEVQGATLGNAYPSVSLSGAGVATAGQSGAAGTPASTGASPPHDPPGLQRPPVRLALVTCNALPETKRHRSNVWRCTATLLSTPPNPSPRTANRATLTRGSRVYATGSGSAIGGRLRLVVHPIGPLRAGLYTLTLHSGPARVTKRVQIIG